MIKKLNLKKINPDKLKSHTEEIKASRIGTAEGKEDKEEREAKQEKYPIKDNNKFELDFSIDTIKKKYLFPFNQSFLRSRRILGLLITESDYDFIICITWTFRI